MFAKSLRISFLLATSLLVGCHVDPSDKMVGKQFPSFALPAPNGTDSVRSANLKGGPALVVFWATWCGPCLDEVGELRQVLSKRGPEGLKIVGLSVDETSASVPLVVSKVGIPYPVATGALPLFDSLGLESLPQSYLLDKNGVVAASFNGLQSASDFDQAIEKLSKR